MPQRLANIPSVTISSLCDRIPQSKWQKPGIWANWHSSRAVRCEINVYNSTEMVGKEASQKSTRNTSLLVPPRVYCI